MADEFRVIAPDREAHGEEVVDLACKTFGGYFEGHARIRDLFLGDHHYSLAATRIGLLNGKIVTHFGVFDYQMRVGSGRLRTAGIGYVATDPEYRRRGLMDKTARSCLKGLRAAGFDFSLLFGLENFYEQFGYTRAWSEREYTLALADLPAPAVAGELTEFPFQRRADLERMFNRYHARHTGSAERPTYRTWDLRSKKQTAFLWNDGRGRPAGYVSVEDKGARMDVLEAVGESAAVLGAAAFAARKFTCDEIRFVCLAHESPLARQLRRGNVSEKLLHFRNGNALGRLIHLPRALQKMAGEFPQRMKRAGLGDYRGKLAMTDGRDWATLEIDRGAVRVVPEKRDTAHVLRGGDAVSQLILGTDDPEETLEGGRMKVSGEGVFLVRALFPNQYPMLAAGDRF